MEAKKALPKEDSPVSKDQQAAATGQRTKKVFVGGLAPSVDEEAFRAYFEEFGQVGVQGAARRAGRVGQGAAGCAGWAGCRPGRQRALGGGQVQCLQGASVREGQE